MSERRTLITIDYHTDDDTGMYRVGEVDFGIHGHLDEFIDRYGYHGCVEIAAALMHMSYEVKKRLLDKSVADQGSANG